MNQEIIMGVDVSGYKLDVSLNGKFLEYENNESGIAKLISDARKHKVDLVICEATGGYEKNLIVGCNESDVKISCVNPRQVRDFAKASGILAKNDQIDAKILVEYGTIFGVRETNILENQDLKELVCRRTQLVDVRSSEKTRHQKVLSSAVQSSIERSIEALNEEIAIIEEQISIVGTKFHAALASVTFLIVCN